MRFVPWRVPPHSWTRDFSLVSAAFVLLVWPSLLFFGLLGPIVAAAGALVVGGVARMLRRRGSASGSTELHPCRICGEDTLSSTGLCPDHREPTTDASPTTTAGR